MRKREVTPTVVRIGFITEPADHLAAKVVRTLCDGPRTVWADAEGCVVCATVDAPRDIPTQWIVGTFGFGQPVGDIEDDLREVARVHVSTSMITT